MLRDASDRSNDTHTEIDPMKQKTLLGVTLFLIFGAMLAATRFPDAEALFNAKNYKQAAEAYAREVKTNPHKASQREILCYLRLQDFDEALKAAHRYLKRTANTVDEAAAQRLVGNLYLALPHWGTRTGGQFYRGQYKQGIRLQSHRHDRALALKHLQKARELYATQKGDLQERMDCLFDLASACTRFGIFENEPHYWFGYWGQRDDTLAQTAGEEDFDEQQNQWQWQRKRPIGLRVDDAGEPMFPPMPKAWADDLAVDQKALFLLAEIRTLDTTSKQTFAKLSWYRQAMLARSRFGMDRANRYRSMLGETDGKGFGPWQLDHDEALILAGGRLRSVTLPTQWNVLSLLEKAKTDQALYAAGLYHQSRQQYSRALASYEALKRNDPRSQWASRASSNASLIRQPQVHLQSSGVQLAGQDAALQVSYRNATKIWFVARKINVVGFLQDIRHQPLDSAKGMREIGALQNWHYYFTRNHGADAWLRTLMDKHLGEEVARWSVDLEPSEDFRHAKAICQTPLRGQGGILVYAFLKEPPVTLPKRYQGDSRAVVLLSDLAVVEKQTDQGRLYFLSDARTGKPVAGADLSIMETWNVWHRQKRQSTHHRKFYQLKTDAQGLALFNQKRNQGSRLYLLTQVKNEQGNRFAYTGMAYWYRALSSSQRNHSQAYCMTDRPVYRPGQKMQFKIWLRQWREGQWHNLPQQAVSLAIHDPRGNKIKSLSLRTDPYGAIHAQLPLNKEATLGLYRIQIHGYNQVTGNTFRVEEYKKPEFEVTVKPNTTHAQLGQTLKATIHGQYFFGQPVTHATVQYKIYRQTYQHRQYPQGRWNWLYGQGYGLTWYESPWFDWWPRARHCFIAPNWWYGFTKPVRELVRQGTGQLDDKGNLTVSINTAAALRDHPDQDHQYTIEAEVRDQSRRVIVGQGQIKVTRQAFFAFVQPDQGYYRPGQQMNLTLQCVSPDGKPVQTQGILSIKAVTWGGPNNADLDATLLETRTIQTDAQGRATIVYRYEKSGQLQFTFVTPDAWGKAVEGYALVWVCGEDFDGKLHRFNDLEIIADQRTYEPGDVAHVLINTKQTDSYVLLSTDAQNGVLHNWQVIHVPGRSRMVEVPIDATQRPNFFIEATTIANARVYQQQRQLCVPPVKAVLDVTVQTDKPNYQPGEEATVSVTTRGPDGKPVSAQLTVGAFDQSLLYIQGQTQSPIARFFHGRVNHHRQRLTTNLFEQFSTWGDLTRPFESLGNIPPSWHGYWGPAVSDWRLIKDVQLGQLLGRRHHAMASGQMRVRKSLSSMPASTPILEMAADSVKSEKKVKRQSKNEADISANSPPAAPTQVREHFADTALWLTTLTTDAAGQAKATFVVPENLTTWQINTWAMTQKTQVGEAKTSTVSTKKLLVRLQTPRFFTERDEVVLSANIHNNLDTQQTVTVSLELPAERITLLDRTTQRRQIVLEAHHEARVDWRVKVKREGDVRIVVKALAGDASDAMAMTIPVLVHGIMRQITTTGSMLPEVMNKTITVQLDVPKERRPELTTLEVRFAPSLVGAMLDALPYCLDYPYGCTEQTVSRFLPAVLTRKTLQNMGIKLEDLKGIGGHQDEAKRAGHTYLQSPVLTRKNWIKLLPRA